MEYYYGQESNLFTFYQVPKELIKNPKYKRFSAESKLLYGLLLDRNSLSQKNGWIDEQGRVYIYFSREEVMEELGIAREKVVKLFAELREAELIEEVRQGQGQPNIIYVGRFIPSQNVGEMPANPHESSEVRKSKFKTFEKPTSGSSKIETQDFRKSKPNKTEGNNTEEMILSQSVSQSDPEDTNKTDGLTDELTFLYQKAQIDKFHDESLQELFKDVIKELYSEHQSKIQKLDLSHIDRALAKYRIANEENPIKNPKLYFKRCLLSAIEEVALQNIGYEQPESPKKAVGGTEKEEVKRATSEEQQRFKDNMHEWAQETRHKLTGTAGT